MEFGLLDGLLLAGILAFMVISAHFVTKYLLKSRRNLREQREKEKIEPPKNIAGFGIRFAARIIDEVIVFVIPTIIFTLLLGATQNPIFILITFLWWAIPGNLYYIYFHHKTGQTIGKKALGLKAVKTDGKSLTWGDAFLRWLVYRIGTVPLYLGQFWVAIDSKKQGWHDKIAKTCVVRVEKQ